MGLKDKIVRALALRWLRGKIKDLRSKDKESNMGKVLKFLDGWKLAIGVVALFAVKLYDASINGHSGDIVGAVLAVLGWLPPAEWTGEAMTAAAASALVLIGFVGKLWKAQKQLRAGSPVSGLLSAEGYAAQARAERRNGR